MIVDVTNREKNYVSENNTTLRGNGIWNLEWPRKWLLLWLIY